MTRALVTGAGRRLGRAMALDLASRGYDVAVHYASSASGARSAAEEIAATGRNAAVLQADLLNEDDVGSLVPRAAEALGGPLTVLVNNASIFERDTVQSMTRDSWDRHFESNLRAPVVLTQALAAQVPDPLTDAQGEPVAQGLVVQRLLRDGRVEVDATQLVDLVRTGLSGSREGRVFLEAADALLPGHTDSRPVSSSQP